jgi:hypothetical protein
MTAESISRFASELERTSVGVLRTEDAGRTLLRVKGARFPTGCIPGSTDALVVLDPAQPKPRLLVKDKPRTPKGMEPRNVNPETVAGESWFCFSYNVAWDEGRHTAMQFVEGAIRRFAKDE